jgi:glutamine synthetase
VKHDIFSEIKAARYEFVDLMYTDLMGSFHHLTLPSERFNERLAERGVGVDGSSVVGFRAVKAGDMVLIPDLDASFRHPFAKRPTLCVIGDLVDVNARGGFSRDPRFVAKKAEASLASIRPGESSRWLPELEFYVFDAVDVWGKPGHAGYRVRSGAVGQASDAADVFEPSCYRKSYHAAAPIDRFSDLRSDMCAMLAEMGIPVKYHHHEVGPAGQLEIELGFMPLVKAADSVALARWAIRVLARQRGLVATFLPKPLFGEAGSGLHFHQFLSDGTLSAFYSEEAGGPLSPTGRFYVGGLLAHGRALSAFANPSTNSYRRLVPGFEAPVRLTYSIANRTAAIRVPGYATSPDDMRIEYRPPDATCNSHLCVAAMLMAGLDGIRRQLDPGPPLTKDLFSLPASELAAIPALPESLGEALDALGQDHGFLLEGGVFSEDLLTTWSALKRAEEREVAERPHPREYELYL